MELSISQLSLRQPAIISRQYCKNSPRVSSLRFISFKPSTNNIKSSDFPSKYSPNKLILPVGLYGESRFSKPLLYNEHRRDTIRACAQADSADSSSPFAQLSRFGSVCYKFTRPYTMFGLIVSTICVYARVFVENPQLFKWFHVLMAFPGLIALVLANAYFCGINQICDADIDRVNKPYLPIPSGEISIKQAWFLVISEVLAGLLIFRLMNADIITTSIYCLGLLVSTFYNAPPIRFKRSSLATSIINSLTAGVLQNVGVIYATRASLGLPFQWSPSTVFICTFVTLLFVGITNLKDLTDVEGDIKHEIRTFPAIFGPRKTTFFFTGILLLNYIGTVVFAISRPLGFKPFIMVPAHALLALWLLSEARKLDISNYTKEASANFYQFLWKLMGLEYLLFPFI